jgi:cephalosporin hydroxylase
MSESNQSLQELRGVDLEELRRVTARFGVLYERLSWQTLGATRWLGQSIVKPPQDIVSLQEIVYETRPDLIIETGVFGGGSAFFFASLFDLLGIDGQVIGVDINVSTVPAEVIEHPRIRLIEGSSTNPRIVASLTEAAQGRRVMVDLDSDHSAHHVDAELRALAPLVSPGCYLVVEDTWLGGSPLERDAGSGPGGAVQTWLEEGQPFEIDRWRERLLLTSNPGGYLLRTGAELPGPRRDEYVAAELDRNPAPSSDESSRPSHESRTSTGGGERPELVESYTRLAGAERRLRTQLEIERDGRKAEVAALVEELDRQGRFLADRERRLRAQRDQLKLLRKQASGTVRARVGRRLKTLRGGDADASGR